MRRLTLFLFALLLFGCASAPQENENYNKIYMESCLKSGMMAVGLDDVLREEEGLPAVDGMYISNVEPGSAAAAAVGAEQAILYSPASEADGTPSLAAEPGFLPADCVWDLTFE